MHSFFASPPLTMHSLFLWVQIVPRIFRWKRKLWKKVKQQQRTTTTMKSETAFACSYFNFELLLLQNRNRERKNFNKKKARETGRICSRIKSRSRRKKGRILKRGEKKVKNSTWGPPQELITAGMWVWVLVERNAVETHTNKHVFGKFWLKKRGIGWNLVGMKFKEPLEQGRLHLLQISLI